MRIKFMGIKARRKDAGGCAPCKARQGSTGFERSKRITMPNGNTRTFTAHRPENVAPSEAEYLLSLTYEYQGKTEHMFKECM